MNSFYEFYTNINTPEKCLSFLRERGIINSDAPRCPECEGAMTQVKRTGISDGYIWRCPVDKNRTFSIRKGSYLQKSHVTFVQFLSLVYCWALSLNTAAQATICGVSEKTVVEYNQFFRQICGQWLLINPVRLGGPGKIVQIDGSLLAKRENKKQNIPERWLFGLYDTTRKVGILEFVSSRSHKTLFPIIQQYVLPGTEIHSYDWVEYGNGAIAKIPVTPPYVHKSVNHCLDFGEPESSVHTNNVQWILQRARHKFSEMCGASSQMLSSYLDEITWRQLHGGKTLVAFDNLLQQISMLDPPI